MHTNFGRGYVKNKEAVFPLFFFYFLYIEILYNEFSFPMGEKIKSRPEFWARIETSIKQWPAKYLVTKNILK